MTFVEAFQAITRDLDALQVKDVRGELLEGGMCFGLLEKVSYGQWGASLEDLRAGMLTPTQFYERVTEFIDLIQRKRKKRELLQLLIELDREIGGRAS